MRTSTSDRETTRDDTLVLIVALVVMLGTLLALMVRPILGL